MKIIRLLPLVPLTLVMGYLPLAHAGCNTPAPRPAGFANEGGSCPSNYYASGNACVPSGQNAPYAFFNAGGSCPSNYYSSGNSCVASSSSACHAFYNSGGSCPSGYYSSGNCCVSN